MRREAERLGVGMDALALAAALAQPWADVVLSGAVTIEQLQSNVRALDSIPRRWEPSRASPRIRPATGRRAADCNGTETTCNTRAIIAGERALRRINARSGTSGHVAVVCQTTFQQNVGLS